MKNIRKMIFASLSAASLFGLAACDEPETRFSVCGDGRIRFESSVVPHTRVTGTDFDEGDRIGLYCVRSADDPAQALGGMRYIDNKPLAMTGGTFAGTTPCFWPDKDSGPFDFYAYYPYQARWMSAGKHEVEIGVGADQRLDEEYRQSDFMLAAAPQVPRTKEPVRLNFKHLMCKLDFELLPGEGFDGVDGLLRATLLLLDLARVANVDFTSGRVSSPAICADIKPHGAFCALERKAVGVSAIVVPQRVEAASYFVSVNLGGQKFRFVTDSALVFESGKRYTFMLTINRMATGAEVLVQPRIEEWAEGASLSGDTVVVDPDDDADSVCDYDDNEYPIVRIGTQQWLGTNLRTTHFNDGTPISCIEDQYAWGDTEVTEEPAFCYCEGDPEVASYGLLYNWHAVHTAKLCPAGWRVPSRDDWNAMAEFLGTETVGECVKSTWGWYDVWGDTKPEYQGTNSSGFNAKPTGYRKWNKYEKAGVMTTWWTADVHPMSSLSAYYARVQGDNKLLTSGSAWGKESGCSVRCIKESGQTPDR